MALDTLSKAIGDTIDLSVGDIIAKFGGDKRAIALAAQKGEIDPTKAVMAGMAVDRVVASAAQPQNTTVAEDALPGGLMAAQGFTDPTAQPQMGQPQAPQRPGQGLNQVPVPQRGFAGGGIVGFQAGGRSSLQDILKQMSMQELEYYNRTGRLPEKYRMMMPGAEPTFTGALRDQGVPTSSVGAPMAPTPSTTPRLTFGKREGFIGLSPEQVDPFSGTQTYGGDITQADVGYVPPAGTPEAEPSPAIARAGLAAIPPVIEEPTRDTRPAQPATPPKPSRSSFDEILREVQGQMPGGEAFGTLEREILKDREGRDKEKEQAGWLRLAEAGLGIAGGESPYFAVNVGKGAAAALKGYAEDLREQKKLDREDKKILADIEQARRAEKAGNIKLASERYERALDRANQADQNRLRVEAQLQAAMMSASRPSDQIQMIREMMRDPNFKEMALSIEREKAAAKDPLADLIRQAREGSGANLGAQLGELMKKYPQAFQ